MQGSDRERELFHQIRNDLQGVAGLLYAEKYHYPEASAALQQAINHVMNIALVYQLQSYRRDLRIDLRELLLAIGQRVEQQIETAQAVEKPDDPIFIENRAAVYLALIINELINNAVMHSGSRADVGSDPDQGDDSRRSTKAAELFCERQADAVVVRVSNAPAALPQGFDFQRQSGLKTGLRLVHSLLPPQGASLGFEQIGSMVVAELVLSAPVIDRQ